MYHHSSMDKKYADQYGKLLLQICINSIRMFIIIIASLWNDTNDHTCG